MHVQLAAGWQSCSRTAPNLCWEASQLTVTVFLMSKKARTGTSDKSFFTFWKASLCSQLQLNWTSFLNSSLIGCVNCWHIWNELSYIIGDSQKTLYTLFVFRRWHLCYSPDFLFVWRNSFSVTEVSDQTCTFPCLKFDQSFDISVVLLFFIWWTPYQNVIDVCFNSR